jgi:hypothetical protein
VLSARTAEARSLGEGMYDTIGQAGRGCPAGTFALRDDTSSLVGMASRRSRKAFTDASAYAPRLNRVRKLCTKSLNRIRW